MGLGGRGMMSGMRKTRTNTTLLSPPHLGLGKRGSGDPRRRARPCVRVMRALFFHPPPQRTFSSPRAGSALRARHEYYSPLSPAGILARGRDAPSPDGIAICRPPALVYMYEGCDI